jgi:hypothetical protein
MAPLASSPAEQKVEMALAGLEAPMGVEAPAVVITVAVAAELAAETDRRRMGGQAVLEAAAAGVVIFR